MNEWLISALFKQGLQFLFERLIFNLKLAILPNDFSKGKFIMEISHAKLMVQFVQKLREHFKGDHLGLTDSFISDGVAKVTNTVELLEKSTHELIDIHSKIKKKEMDESTANCEQVYKVIESRKQKDKLAKAFLEKSDEKDKKQAELRKHFLLPDSEIILDSKWSGML